MLSNEILFQWDDANRAELAGHDVTPEEVEQVFANKTWDLRPELVGDEEWYPSVGHTNLVRVIVVAWTMRGRAVRPITAFEASLPLVKQYFAGRVL